MTLWRCAKFQNDTTMNNLKRLLTAIVLFISVLPVFAGNADTLKSIFEVLAEQPILEVNIATDLKSLTEDRRSNTAYAGLFTFANGKKEKKSLIIELQTRGKFRRRNCDFPPLWLKFPKKTLSANGLNKTFNDLKLVTHCLDDKTIGTECLLREYLTYKLYQILTPNSYRVQLAKITYEDTAQNLGKITRYGFIIEDTDEMAARLGGVENEQLNVAPDSISAADERIMALFEYMIGNADWNMAMLRNIKMVKLENGISIPVPYDFDFSGLVKAPYAVPQSDLGLFSIRDRKYLGLPFNSEEMRATLGYFLAKKPALLREVKAFKLLPAAVRADISEYLETFFESIEPAFNNREIDLTAFFSLQNATVEKLALPAVSTPPASGRR